MRLDILYVGNKLSAHGYNMSYMETLGPYLEKEGHIVSYSSDKKNKIVRYLDMLITLSRKRNSIDLVLIDTYSTLNYWYAVSVAKLCMKYDIPYIPILHGGNLPHRAKSSRASFKKLIENAFVAVCPSKYLQESLSTQGFSNFEIIKNTVAIDDYRFKARKSAQPNLLCEAPPIPAF